MNKTKRIDSKNDVIVRASDFIVEHSSKEFFSDHYTLDPHILGEGAFGKV